MPVPWIQIVQWVPSILEVSRELLNRSRRPPATPDGDLVARVAALEENERRQAELVNRMAEQTAQLTTAITALHRQAQWLMVGQGVAVGLALLAIVLVLTRW